MKTQTTPQSRFHPRRLSMAIHAMGRVLTALAGALTVSVLSTAAHAASNHPFHFNPEIPNRTNSPANDWHIRFRGTQPISVTRRWLVGQVPFTKATITGNQTTDVTINYSGATVNPGQSTHAGADLLTDGDLTIIEDWWTLDGVRVTGSQGLASYRCLGDQNKWIVAKTELYSAEVNGTLLGTEWAECRGTDIQVINAMGGTIWGRTARLPPCSTEVTLDRLNASLAGFGPFGPVAVIPSSYPVPATTGIWVALLGLMLGVSALYVLRRRGGLRLT
jgi:hypothetical protein